MAEQGTAGGARLFNPGGLAPVKGRQPDPRQLRDYDTRDDRTEVYRLLAMLAPARRVAFLEWACAQSTLPCSLLRPHVDRSTYELAKAARWDDAASDRLNMDVFMSCWLLSTNYDVDLKKIVLGLEQFVRRQGRR